MASSGRFGSGRGDSFSLMIVTVLYFLCLCVFGVKGLEKFYSVHFKAMAACRYH